MLKKLWERQTEVKTDNLLLFIYFWENFLKNRSIRQYFSWSHNKFYTPFLFGMLCSCRNDNFCYCAQSSAGTKWGPINGQMLVCWTHYWIWNPSSPLFAPDGPTRQSKVTDRQSCIVRIVRSNNGKKSVRISWRS